MSPKKPADSSTAKPVNPELPKEREAELKKQFDNLECDFKKPEDFVQEESHPRSPNFILPAFEPARAARVNSTTTSLGGDKNELRNIPVSALQSNANQDAAGSGGR